LPEADQPVAALGGDDRAHVVRLDDERVEVAPVDALRLAVDLDVVRAAAGRPGFRSLWLKPGLRGSLGETLTRHRKINALISQLKFRYAQAPKGELSPLFLAPRFAPPREAVREPGFRSRGRAADATAIAVGPLVAGPPRPVPNRR